MLCRERFREDQVSQSRLSPRPGSGADWVAGAPEYRTKVFDFTKKLTERDTYTTHVTLDEFLTYIFLITLHSYDNMFLRHENGRKFTQGYDEKK